MEPRLPLLSWIRKIAYAGAKKNNEVTSESHAAHPAHFSQNPPIWVTPIDMPTDVTMAMLPQTVSVVSTGLSPLAFFPPFRNGIFSGIPEPTSRRPSFFFPLLQERPNSSPQITVPPQTIKGTF
uniref:Uncharacterized protein n=1 Tax=Anguilla anguilla TaxID=7936 RepID=A0A0E9X5S1_ANGAN